MRITAKEVSDELESTRSELARGVMELPEETKASAAAMRRVVAEQIEALSELNAIVRAQPATHDVNDRRPARSDSREERPTRAERTEPEAPRTTPPAPSRTTFTQTPLLRTVKLQQPTPTPTPAPAAAAEIKPPAPRSDEGGGWLRDVLRNANNAAATAQAQQNFTGLTDEIARAIDPGALADSWQRYQNGEQNAFSRRIYTLTGQSTYDDIRKRLQRDPEFARSATNYIGEFEQVLKRAASGPDPLEETRSILLSDRGKVYTMLAHANGRLG
jgi:hypothetical protein